MLHYCAPKKPWDYVSNMDICTCKDNKRVPGFIRNYVLLASALYVALCVAAYASGEFDLAMLVGLIGLLVAIMFVVALWRMRGGHSFKCALLWAYVSPIAESHKSINNLTK